MNQMQRITHNWQKDGHTCSNPQTDNEKLKFLKFTLMSRWYKIVLHAKMCVKCIGNVWIWSPDNKNSSFNRHIKYMVVSRKLAM